MDINELIDNLRFPSWQDLEDPDATLLGDAADALSTLQAENEEMQKKLNEFSEFLCHMTGGVLSKTNYTAQAMISAAEDYQQRVCDNYCDLRADLARVTAERDAAVKDLNEFLAMGELCPIQCEWCKWKDTFCDGKTPEWRGIQKED